MRYKIGVDIGGTFTDTTLLMDDGSVTIHKMPSTPSNPEEAVLQSAQAAIKAAGVSADDCTALVNSSTVAVNAIIQRQGANVGLIVTKGFEDILELGRVKMNDVFSLDSIRPQPLTPKNLVRGVSERTSSSGSILVALDKSQVLRAVDELLDLGAQSIAVLFLHAYRNEKNEREAKLAIAERHLDLFVAISSEVWPQIREYERATALVMNSYIAPKVSRYISELERRKVEIGLDCPLYISGSNGGVLPSEVAKSQPITTLLSGPSAGIVAAIHMASNAGISKAITLDMGGTSADICVIEKPEIPYAWGQEIQGLPIVVPYVDVSSIGAGGGSIAYIDNAGLLRVGPDSAGSDPGPAAYKRGGTKPTLTDAYVVAGYINPNELADGMVKLDLGAAKDAIRPLADRLEMSLNEAASGIIRVATSNLMAEFARLVANKGIDPRDFVLVPFGGAGPSHACLLANELHLKELAIPASPGTFCALGSVLAEFRLDYLKTVYTKFADLDEIEVNDWYNEILDQTRVLLGREESNFDDFIVIRTAEVRYEGQGYEVAVQFQDVAEIPTRFQDEYSKLYGPRSDEAAIEIISIRATVINSSQKTALTWTGRKEPSPSKNSRTVWFMGQDNEWPVYQRQQMPPGWSAEGPFLVEQPDTTCVVTPNWSAVVDEFGTLRLTKGQKNVARSV